MKTNKLQQISAVQHRIANQWGFRPDSFHSKNNLILESSEVFFEMVTFGEHAIIRVDKEMLAWCEAHMNKLPACELMDGDQLFLIEAELRKHGKKLAGEHVRYLYGKQTSVKKPTGYEYRLFDQLELKELYANKNFHNALNYKNDVIALGAFAGQQLVALAGADDYMKNLWQIGIDTLPAYRNKGLATYLVQGLAVEIETRGAIPYYTTWGANIASTLVALRAGFFPAWVSYYAVEHDQI